MLPVSAIQPIAAKSQMELEFSSVLTQGAPVADNVVTKKISYGSFISNLF